MVSQRQVQRKNKSTKGFKCDYIKQNNISLGNSMLAISSGANKETLDIFKHAGIGASYKVCMYYTNAIANSVLKTSDKLGTYIPSGLVKNVPIHFALDNIDFRIHNSDGKNSFHGTAILCYQAAQIDQGQEIINKLSVITTSATVIFCS